MAWLVVAQGPEAASIQHWNDMVPQPERCAERVSEEDDGAIFGGRVERVRQDP